MGSKQENIAFPNKLYGEHNRQLIAFPNKLYGEHNKQLIASPNKQLFVSSDHCYNAISPNFLTLSIISLFIPWAI